MILYAHPFEIVVGIGAVLCVFGMPLAIIVSLVQALKGRNK
jgi:hypothetical protein